MWLSEERRPTRYGDVQIMAGEQQFQRGCGTPFAKAYTPVLHCTGGVLHNGVSLWPLATPPFFRKAVRKANQDVGRAAAGTRSWAYHSR